MKKLLFTFMMLSAFSLAGCNDKKLGDDASDKMKQLFPDPVFRAYVLENFDIDGDGKISDEEAEQVTEIDVKKRKSTPDNEKIATLKGIQYFTNLTTLYCSYNKLTELDVTQNTALIYLLCDSNQLTELDVTQNTALTYLLCESNQLTELDVTQNTALKTLYCYSNQLTTLDVSKTNLGNSTELVPLFCAPMNGSGLETLYLKEGWMINYIYPERNDGYVPANTDIRFKD